MRTVHSIVSEMARTGQVVKVTASRREIAKARQTGKSRRTTPTTQIMQPRAPRTTKSKMRWPTRDTTFVLETERRTRDERHAEHPLVTMRRKQHDPKVKSNRTR